MGYGFDLFTPQAGETPEETLERLAHDLDPLSADGRNEQIAEVLIAYDTQLVYSLFDETEIELIHEHWGITIYLFSHSAGLTLVNFYEKAEARQAFTQIVEYLRLIQAHTNYAIYDLQVGRFIDIDADLPTIMATYLGS